MGAFVWLRTASLLALAGAIATPASRAAAQNELADEAGSAVAAVADTDEQAQEIARTIVVTGTRIQAPNRRSASPVETVRPEDFTLTGVPNVEQTLNQLPQIVPSFTNTSNNPGSGAATLDLRGLGTVRTLILFNGRRWIANDAGQIPEIDVNTIPAALIERVDIVTGGASAVYGSDAVTGVINFVLKSRLRGLHLEARQNITERGDGRVSSADLSFGTGFLDARGNLLVSVGWLDQAPVLQADRKFTAFALSDGCVVPGTVNEFGWSTPVPKPVSLCGGPGEELGFIAAGSSIIPQGLIRGGPTLFPGPGNALLPSGQTRFTPDGGLVPFVFARDAFNFAPENYLQLRLQRISGHALASLAISNSFEPYTELSFIRTRSPQQLASATGILGTGTGTVPAFMINLDNPFLSDQARQILDVSYGVDAEGDRGFIGNFQNGFIVNPDYDGDADGLVRTGSFNTRLTGLGPRQGHNERHAYRGLIGIRGQVSPAFEYDVYFSASDVKHEKPLANSASASRLQQAVLARFDPGTGQIACIDPSNGCVPVNIFGGQGISEAAAEFIRADVMELTRVKEQIAEAVVKGSLIELPAGPLRLAGGAQWRRTTYRYTPDRSLELGDNLGFNPSTGSAGKTRVAEVFGEALVPLISERPFAHDLHTELGLRYSHYNVVGGVWTWKAMGQWSPVRQVRVRAGLQRAVRAPNIHELYEESTTSGGGGIDPCSPFWGLTADPAIAAACTRLGAGNLPPLEDAFFLVTTSGSTALKAESAKTLTAGIVVQPVPALAISADYFDIDIRDAIGRFGGGGQFVLFGCIGTGGDPPSSLCQAIERRPDGQIAELTLPTANLARIRARGIDWQLSYVHQLFGGDARLYLSGTRLLSSKYQPNPGIDPIDCAGAFSGPCGGTITGSATPDWKLFNRFSWSSGPLTLSFRHRFFSSMENALFRTRVVLGLPFPPIPVRAHRLESRHYFDASATAAIGNRFELTFGVNNLTDRKPSLLGSDQVQANTDPSLYDMLGRRYFAVVRASW